MAGGRSASYRTGRSARLRISFPEGYCQDCMEALCNPSTLHVLAQGSKPETMSLLSIEEGNVASNGAEERSASCRAELFRLKGVCTGKGCVGHGVRESIASWR